MALTPEQVENWRKVLRGAIGPYAGIVPEEQIQKLAARMQSQLTPVAADVPCTCPRFESGSKVFPMRECDGCRKSSCS